MKPLRRRVLKFGGTSLDSEEKHRQIAALVRKALLDRIHPLLVVSAPGRRGAPYATDTLLQFIHRDLPEANHVLGTSLGEIISSLQVASSLRENGIRSIALTGKEAGIQTVGSCKNAVIRQVDPSYLNTLLQEGWVPVIAGFQGADSYGTRTLLSRGGSDATATAIAAALAADRVEIYTDVPGIMTADPRRVQQARIIPSLVYEEAHRLASRGAKVIHPEAVRWAASRSIPLHIMSLQTASADKTLIMEGAPRFIPLGLTYREEKGWSTMTVVYGASQPVSAETIRTIVDAVPSRNLEIRQGEGSIDIRIPSVLLSSVLCSIHQLLFEREEEKYVSPAMAEKGG
ncbi:amino acid kinase family protein [Salinithrix halophila]|uniref:aspartate kinase n=1 Tax=Salinithrix halophila TaxID=1485204 RepID=A0ABV8JBW0_9BACL